MRYLTFHFAELKCLLRFKEQNKKFDQKCYEMLTSRTELFAKAAEVLNFLEVIFRLDC